MSKLKEPPPTTRIDSVVDLLHGFAVADPYRWLEEQDSPETREWIEGQTRYARSYLDNVPGRKRIRSRIREFLAIETYDSLQFAGGRYFFRKRLPDEEQPCIYMREGAGGEDQLLLNPLERGTGKYTAVRPLRVSSDGRLLLYEVKEGGERTGTFELLEIETRKRLSDSLPRGYLHGFAFAPDNRSFYYVHDAVETKRPLYRAAYHHVLGATKDQEIFFAGDDEETHLSLFSDGKQLAFLVVHCLEKTLTDIYLKALCTQQEVEPFICGIDYYFSPFLHDGRIFALTDLNAPNRRIVEIRISAKGCHEWIDVVPEGDTQIDHCHVVGQSILVSYRNSLAQQFRFFDFSGTILGELPTRIDETIRIVASSMGSEEVFIEKQSFTEAPSVFRCSVRNKTGTLWAQRTVPFKSENYGYSRVWFTSSDGTTIPMYLVGRHDVLESNSNPTIMTSYGGYGVSMTPQFSIFVAFLIEHGCLFALPNIRGGSEFGVKWHMAAKRRNRQTAYDDFLCAAEWLIETGRTDARRLAIFGGSNSGLLVGAALTQRPDLFRAVVCMLPILDMLRYHLFDSADLWKEEFGTARDPEDFHALRKYSPYHRVEEGVRYPAVMLVSGDADRNCNPLHARKMTARLQAANSSEHPILLDYSKFRGHSPVLPLSERIEALADRLAFLCDQLQLVV
jgi:prolyl oligopeptidase